MPRTLQQATAVITDSEFVRGELIEILNVPADKITAIPLGVDSAFHPRDPKTLTGTLERYGLTSKNYLLVVATLEPRKNLARLVKAYTRLAAPLRDNHPLVIVGGSGWLTEDLEKRLARLERSGQIRRLGYVLQEDLPIIYAGAWAFAFPSLYEGFGLPVLEAMASGVPVLTSNRSSLPEVAGGATLLIDPESVDAITAGLEQLLTDTAWRRQAVTDGLRRAQHFSWQRCIENTVDLYRRVLRST